MLKQISWTAMLFLLVFLSFGMRLTAYTPFHTAITWKNTTSLTDPDKFTKTIPLEASCTTSELSPVNGKKRFEVCVTFILKQRDSLYKKGERFIIAHTNSTGSIVANDSIEFANQNFALLDDNHQQATFTFRLTKGTSNTSLNFIFDGGRCKKADVTIDASNYKHIENDFSILCFISVMLLNPEETKKMDDCPSVPRPHRNDLPKTNEKNDTKNERYNYKIFQGETFTFHEMNLHTILLEDNPGGMLLDNPAYPVSINSPEEWSCWVQASNNEDIYGTMHPTILM